MNISVGTISHGTLRTVDLLHAFACELQRIAGASDLASEALERANALHGSADETESDSELVAELQDALDAAAPAGMYFGTLEGDGSDFGFWYNETGRRAAMAQEFAAAFETRTRDNGDSFVALKDGSPQWMVDICRAAQGEMMPDDYRYGMIRDAAERIAETLGDDIDADLDDERDAAADSMVSVYHRERFQWLASNLARQQYCDDVCAEGLLDDTAGISNRIAAGWYAEAEEVYGLVVDALTEAAA